MKKAFSGVPLPSARELGGGELLAEEIMRCLGGKEWWRLSPEDLNATDFWLWFDFLSPIGFRYYLPAPLCHSLREFPHGELVLVTLDGLSPCYPDVYIRGRDRDLDRRIDLLSPSQYQVVCEFLGLLRKLPEYELSASMAVRWAWNKEENDVTREVAAFYERMGSYEVRLPADPRLRVVAGVIERAFKDVSLPDPRWERPELCHEEYGRAALEYRGRQWRRLHPWLLDATSDALYVLSARAWKYYLPAFLTADLVEELETANPLFALSATEELREFTVRRLSVLDLQQCQAVVSYLAFWAGQGDEFRRRDAESALKDWWLRRLGQLAPQT